MRLRRVHRRLSVLMGLAGLVAFAGGAGFEPLSAALAGVALIVALFWQPEAALSERLERVWLPLAAVLAARALLHVFVIGDDVVIPVIDLLLLLLAAEALRSLDAPNDTRLYALSFALLLAATAYRPGVLFLAAFVVYVCLSTVALMVGHLARKARAHGVQDVPLARSLIGTTLVLSLATLAVAAVVFVTFPRVSRGWAGRGDDVVTSVVGFSDQVSIGEFGSQIYANPQIVLRVEFPGGRPPDYAGLHWRGRSYDRFDGVRWSRSRGLPPSTAPTQWYRERWSGAVLEQRIYGAPLNARVLFAKHPVLGIDADNRIQPIFDNAGDFVYWGTGAPSYTVWSRAGRPAAAELATAQRGFMPARQHYLQLPGGLDPRIARLADSLTAGLDSWFEQAQAVERWLRSFQYTLELPATAREATLEHFLFVRRAGHCEYFSTAMVVMLRTLGIHARNVNGFLGGEWSDFGEYLAVTQNQAHSWVEAWFPGFGWVEFDPTPAGSGEGTREAAWFWPGRFLFDGLQHRWNKWVLDFDVDAQSGLFQRWSGMLSGDRAAGAVRRTVRGKGRSFLGVIVLAAFLAGGFFWANRGGGSVPPATRMYLQLRRVAERAGIDVTPALTPLALLRLLRQTSPGAVPPAERVVDLYLRHRFGGEALGDSDLREMQDALGAVRRTLRARA